MAVDDATFVARCPEFNTAGSALRGVALTQAQLEVDESVWGDKYEEGVFLTAAHKLAVSPYGQNARLTNDGESSIYLRELQRLMRQVGHGYRLI